MNWKEKGVSEVTSSQGVQSGSEQPGPAVGKSRRQADTAELQSCRGITQHGDNGKQISIYVTAKNAHGEKTQNLKLNLMESEEGIINQERNLETMLLLWQ